MLNTQEARREHLCCRGQDWAASLCSMRRNWDSSNSS